MKKVFPLLSFLLVTAFSLVSWTATAEEITTAFKVKGSCGMCKKKIETSLRIKGVKKVNWDKTNQELTITYADDKITIYEIHQRIAAVGYDTDKIKASDESYAKLDDCCRYERD